MATHATLPPVPAASHCHWCGATAGAGEISCPRCGAPLRISERPTKSGWIELPRIKDMTRLQVGHSRCQIEGMYVPVADFNLAPGDSLYFAHHVLLWKDPEVDIRRMPLKGAFTRLMAGLPIIMTEAYGPGHIAFSRDEPGEMIALPLQPGQSVDVREHLFLVATKQISYDWFNTGVWFTTGDDKETEYHYPIGKFMDRFTAGDNPGLLLLHAAGNVFVRELADHQTLLVNPSSLVFTDPSVRLAMHIDYPANFMWNSHPILWLHLSGPGRVAIQSAYEPMEALHKSITGHTPRTWTREQLTAQSRLPSRARLKPATANTPAPARVDERHVALEKMVMEAMADGEVPPSEVARLTQAALKNGLTGYDVRLIINQVKAKQHRA